VLPGQVDDLDLICAARDLPGGPQSIFPLRWTEWHYQRPHEEGGEHRPPAYECTAYFVVGEMRVTRSVRVPFPHGALYSWPASFEHVAELAAEAMAAAQRELEAIYETVRSQQQAKKPYPGRRI
jgi:hypothetical protein